MLAGHLAVALVAKKVEPRLTFASALTAAFWLDFVWPVMLVLGLEKVRVDPGNTAFTHLAFDSYPWTHSLAAVLAWAAAGAALVLRSTRSARAAACAGALVASHWFLDALTHRPDLPLWPGGPLVGAGLWNSVPGTVALEGSMLALGLVAYQGATRATDAIGRWSFAGLAGLIGLVWITQPWSPPPPSAEAVGWGGLVFWLFIPWARWIDRHRENA